MNCPSKRVWRGVSRACLDTLPDTVRVSRDRVAGHAVTTTGTHTVSVLATPHIGGVGQDVETRSVGDLTLQTSGRTPPVSALACPSRAASAASTYRSGAM